MKPLILILVLLSLNYISFSQAPSKTGHFQGLSSSSSKYDYYDKDWNKTDTVYMVDTVYITKDVTNLNKKNYKRKPNVNFYLGFSSWHNPWGYYNNPWYYNSWNSYYYDPYFMHYNYYSWNYRYPHYNHYAWHQYNYYKPYHYYTNTQSSKYVQHKRPDKKVYQSRTNRSSPNKYSNSERRIISSQNTSKNIRKPPSNNDDMYNGRKSYTKRTTTNYTRKSVDIANRSKTYYNQNSYKAPQSRNNSKSTLPSRTTYKNSNSNSSQYRNNQNSRSSYTPRSPAPTKSYTPRSSGSNSRSSSPARSGSSTRGGRQ